MTFRVLIVTDPMCSWCWGMSRAVDDARAARANLTFDLVFGGINVDSTKPVGRFGRHRLARLWAEVREVTGVSMAPAPPTTPFVYNSVYLCHVLEAARLISDEPPFDLLRSMQDLFFGRALDITKPEILQACISECGLDSQQILDAALTSPIRARVTEGFEAARAHGTHALPSVVLQTTERRALLVGGFVDTATLIRTIDHAIAVRRSSPPRA